MRTLFRSRSVSIVSFALFFLSFSETSFAVPYSLDGSFTAQTIQTNQQGRSARNASMTIQMGGLTNGFPALNNTSTQCFNQPGPGPAYAYVIALDFSFLQISQCEAYNGTEIIRNSGAFIIDPFTAFMTKATPTEIANAMVAKGNVGTAFTITSGGGRDVIFTRTDTSDGNIVYTDSNFASSDAFRVTNVISGQSPLISLVQQSTFTPANVGSGELYLMDIDGYTYEYTAQAGDGVSQVSSGIVAAYNAAPLGNVNCVDQTTRILCSGTVDTQTFSIDAYVTHPTPDTIAPLLTVVGNANSILEYGTPFADPGATWIDNRDGTGTIMGSGTVDHMTIGTYTITYNKSDLAGNVAPGVTRTVTVADTTAPSFSLNGFDPVTVEIDTGYTDEGAIWSDTRDGGGTVFANAYTITTLGNNVITYQYTDAAGNTGTITRTLNVVDTVAPTLSINTAPTTVDANVFPVRGSIGGYGSVTISGGASPVTLSNVNNSFTAYVPLTQNALNTLLITATDLGNNVSTGTLLITESGAASGFSGAINMNGSSLSLSGVTSHSGSSLTGATRVIVEAPIFFGGKGGMGTIPTNTVITPASGSGVFDATSINQFNVTVTGGLASNETQQGVVGFGISDTGLHFSKPVKIEIPVTGYSGSTIAVKVRHGGTSTFVTTGLTNNPNATCTNGVASSPSNIATVVSGMATIYTCAASAFVAYTETTTPTPSGSTGGGASTSTPLPSSLSGSPLPPPTPLIPTSGVVVRDEVARFDIDAKTLKKNKILKSTTNLKNGTKIVVYRVSSRGKEIKVGQARVMKSQVQYRIKIKGNYVFRLK